VVQCWDARLDSIFHSTASEVAAEVVATVGHLFEAQGYRIVLS
jgi:hypothetical protein